MKKCVFLCLLLIPVVSAAQYFNPYTGHDFENCPGKVTCGACYGTGNCYGYVCRSCGGTGMMDCAACAGYRQGQQMAEQMKKQRWNNANSTFEDGINALMRKSYSTAMKYLKRSAELGNGSAMAYVGNMYELGLGVEANTQTAKTWYNKGRNRRDNLSISNLNRVQQHGFWKASASNRSTYIQNLINLSNMAAVMSQQIVNGMDWGTSSGSGGGSPSRRSNSGICSTCGGTGVSPISNSGGSLSSWVAYYNSEGNKCPYCGRHTGHFHDKCSSCNVPKF
ncbi:MAG: sel1 repeat family protein [Prevotella sp.]|jgi:hypothetical protein|nr:sel1 repeat family protein [Prevotella sp.]